MSLKKQFYNQFQASNPNKFNKELLDIRQNDYNHMGEIIEGILKSMEIIQGIEVLECTLNTDEGNTPYKIINKFKTVSLYDERKNYFNIKFRVTSDGESDIVEKTLFVPKLIDGIYFIIGGNKYFPILQLVDLNMYKATATKGKNKFTLKTMIMPMVFVQTKNSKIKDIDGNEYIYDLYELNLFKATINFCNYFLSKFGLVEGLNRLGIPGTIIEEVDGKATPLEGYTTFNITKKVIARFPTHIFDDEKTLNVACSLVEAYSKNRINLEKLNDDIWYIKNLGGYFNGNVNNREKKAYNVLSSLERILIDKIKDRLRLPSEVVNDIYNLINYIVEEGNNINKLDVMDLANKRLRFVEYMTYPIAEHASNFTYRALNKVSKLTLATKKQSTSIKPGLLFDDARTHDLIRYDNAVNGLTLFQSILKVTIRGPQGINGDMSAASRDLHPSYVGKMSLVFSSPSSVGESNILTPFCKIYDNLFFFPDENK